MSVPPYHIAAVSSVLSTTYVGRRVVQLETFDPDLWVRTVRDESVTHAMVVPTMLNRILDTVDADGLGLPSMRSLAYGGGPMPRPVVERALRTLPDVDLVNAYGLTETSSTIAVLGPDDHRAAFASDDPAVRARLGSVGPGVARRRAGDPRSRRRAGGDAGETGEIWVRGDQVSGEYLGARASATTAGSTPATPAMSTTTATCSCAAASTTSSSAAARISHRARSNRCWSSIRRWMRRPSSASPTSSGASGWSPRSSSFRRCDGHRGRAA